ncbi:hypothetical protein ACQJBY_069933 [Aegilops geniculata]
MALIYWPYTIIPAGNPAGEPNPRPMPGTRPRRITSRRSSAARYAEAGPGAHVRGVAGKPVGGLPGLEEAAATRRPRSRSRGAAAAMCPEAGHVGGAAGIYRAATGGLPHRLPQPAACSISLSARPFAVPERHPPIAISLITTPPSPVELRASKMAMMVDPPNGMGNHGKHYYTMWQTMFEIDTKYVPIKPIGRGAYGIVCSSINQETNEKVAIKKINNVFDNRVDALRTLRELKLLRHLGHENVIALKDIMMPIHRRSFKDVYLVSELMDMDLHQIVKSSQSLSNDHCQYFLFQLLRGLKYLHSAGILHRDLKPGNLLVNANCDLKICDFGLARTNNTKGQFMTEYVVTRWYRAPELLLCCDNYGTSIDVWSVGCIFAELLGRKPIFPGTECFNQLKLIVNVLGTMSEADLAFIDNPKARNYIKSLPYTPGMPLSIMYPHAHPLAIDLLQKMLVFDPSKRISVTQALEHPYMSPLYDPSANPPAQVPIDLDIDENIGTDMIREMLWQEMLQYHPEAARMVNM